MGVWSRLLKLAGKAEKEAEALKKVEPTLEEAAKARPPTPEDVADYLKTVKETGQTHRAGVNTPPPPSTPPVVTAAAATPAAATATKAPGFFAAHWGKTASGMVVAGVTALGTALGWNSSADPYDDTLSVPSRMYYNYQKTKAQIDKAYGAEIASKVKAGTASAIEKAIHANLELTNKQERESTAGADTSKVPAAVGAARTAPPITFKPLEAPVEQTKAKNDTIPSKIDKMEKSFDVTEEEANKLRGAWQEASKKPDSVKIFADNARAILAENKEVRPPEQVNELALKLAR